MFQRRQEQDLLKSREKPPYHTYIERLPSAEPQYVRLRPRHAAPYHTTVNTVK